MRYAVRDNIYDTPYANDKNNTNHGRRTATRPNQTAIALLYALIFCLWPNVCCAHTRAPARERTRALGGMPRQARPSRSVFLLSLLLIVVVVVALVYASTECADFHRQSIQAQITLNSISLTRKTCTNVSACMLCGYHSARK